MLTPSLNTVMTRLLIVAAVLGTIVFFAPAIFAQVADENMIEYAENGTDAVRTFTSTDPEGSGIDWDVTGLDADDFTIDARGMLMFKSSPDYENPSDRTVQVATDLNGDGDTDDPCEAATVADDPSTRNCYRVTVRATEQETDGADVRALSTETHVIVMVTNVNETGSVTMNRLQPEVGTPITASVSDPDAPTTGLSWQWYVSKVTNPIASEDTLDEHWIEATGANNATETYTPAGKRVEGDRVIQPTPNVAVDEGKYLLAVATYTDSLGEERMVFDGVSANPVRAEVTSDSDGAENPENGSPGFSSTGDYTRSVPEDTPVGDPVGAAVEAIDPNDDTLTYELDDDRDPANPVDTTQQVSYFSIDAASGQVSVKKRLDYDDASTGREYTFFVRATDPSGETAEVEVTVTATDVNDAPKIMGSVSATETGPASSELRANEKDDDNGFYDGSPDMIVPGALGNPNVFIAEDEDARGQVFWRLEGEDEAVFEISSTQPPTGTGLPGRGEPIYVRFKEAPDYENPTDANRDSVYKVTLVVWDSPGAEDARPLTIFVDNVEEAGKATLSDEQPLIGHPITAAVEDPDNGVAIVTWQWEKATSTAANATWTVIPGATAATYTPVPDNASTGGVDEDDDGYYLRVTATYTDITSASDDEGSVRVDERTQKDANNDGNPEAKVASTTASGMAADKLYRVRAVSANAVRVSPTPPTPIDAPQFDAASYARGVVENAEVGTIVGTPVQVMPEKGRSFSYNLDATITGHDDFFTIDPGSGQIRVGEVDFPDRLPAEVSEKHAAATNPAMVDPTLDYEGVKEFTLIVTATDNAASARTATAEVNITLDNLNERPYFDKSTRESLSTTTSPTTTAAATTTYAESRTNAVTPRVLAAVEPDGDDLRWEVTGPDASDFMIVDADDLDDGKDRVQLMFSSQPDFENLGGSATTDEPADTYTVTVRATETSAVGGGPNLAAELNVAVQVLNSQEPGSVEVRWLRPEVDTLISAITTDPDGSVDATVAGGGYQWYRAKVADPSGSRTNPGSVNLAGEWELIDGATAKDYIPTGADNNLYLLARAVYDDAATAGAATTSAMGISAYPVRADVTDEANNSPDFNASKTTRSIAESAAVGDPIGLPVDVDRNEDGDVLTYELVKVMAASGTAATPNDPGDPGNDSVDTEDVEYFSIDKETGQLMVAKTLSAEDNDGRDYSVSDPPVAGKYTVVVRATDPSGEGSDENRDDIVVTVTATDVNEAPSVVGMAELSVDENEELATTTNVYLRDEEDVVDRAIWPEPIPGPDGALFEYSVPEDGIGRRLHFISPPNFENPQDANRDNVYEVEITVEDEDGASGSKTVRVTVNNVDEMGTLELSPDQPDDGMPVIATLTDPDGVVSITDWQWAATTTRNASADSIFPEMNVFDPDAGHLISSGATTDRWTGKVGEFLWAKVYYRDGYSVTDHPVTALDERNDDPDTTAANETEQHKYQDKDAAGNPDAGDTLFHNSDVTLAKEAYNAVQPDPDPADDPDAPPTGIEPFEVMVYENVPSTGYVGVSLGDPGARETIGGPDGATFVFAEDNDQSGSTYYDAILAPTVDHPKDKAGQLALAPVTHLDFETKDTYIIEVSDPDAEVALSTYRVTIRVLDVNEAPTAPSELRGPPPTLNAAPEFLDADGNVATSTTRMVAENTAAGMAIGDPVVATDPDRGDQETVVYTLGGDDAASFAIDSATGQLSTSAPLDYETDNEYTVTVTATDDDDASSMIYVTISVTDEGLATPYDANEDGVIDSSEVLMAVADYFAGDIDDPTVLEVVMLYFAGL